MGILINYKIYQNAEMQHTININQMWKNSLIKRLGCTSTSTSLRSGCSRVVKSSAVEISYGI